MDNMEGNPTSDEQDHDVEEPATATHLQDARSAGDPSVEDAAAEPKYARSDDDLNQEQSNGAEQDLQTVDDQQLAAPVSTSELPSEQENQDVEPQQPDAADGAVQEVVAPAPDSEVDAAPNDTVATTVDEAVSPDNHQDLLNQQQEGQGSDAGQHMAVQQAVEGGVQRDPEELHASQPELPGLHASVAEQDTPAAPEPAQEQAAEQLTRSYSPVSEPAPAGDQQGLTCSIPPQHYTQSAPSSPSHVMRSRHATASLAAAAVRHRDAMVCARAVLEDRALQATGTATINSRFGAVETRRLIHQRVTKTTPHSLVLTAKRGRPLTPPEGWRSQWSASDYKQVLAADRQLEQLEVQRQAQERKSFQQELAARESRSPSPVGRLSQPTSQPTSPARERELRVLSQAQQNFQQRQERFEQKWERKAQQTVSKVAKLQQSKAQECATKHEGTDRAITETLQRAEVLEQIKSTVRRLDASKAENHRLNVSMRKQALVSRQTEHKSTYSLKTMNHAQARYTHLREAHDLYQQQKLRALQAATMAAAHRQSELHSRQSQRIAKDRELRFAVASEKLAEHQRYNELAGQRVALEQRRREAVSARRQKLEREREQQTQHKQLGELMARHYAKQFEMEALVTNKLPTVTPGAATTLARFGIKAS